MATKTSLEAAIEKARKQYGKEPVSTFKEAGITVRDLAAEAVKKGDEFTFPEVPTIFPAKFNGNAYALFFSTEGLQINPGIFYRVAFAASDNKKYKSSGEVVDLIQKVGDLDEAWPQLKGKTAVVTNTEDITCVNLDGEKYTRRIFQIDWKK